MAASVPSFWNWRSPSSCEFLSSSEEEECGESDYCYDEDGYGEEEYDEEGEFVEEEEKYDEEGEFDEEEEECDEEGEFVEEEEECDEEGEFVEEEEECDEEGEFVEEEEECDEGGEFVEEEEECDEEGEFVEEEEECDEEGEFDEEEEECDEDEYFDEQEEESYLVSDVLDCHKPSTWRYMPPDREVDLVQLPANSPEYLKVKSKVQSTLQVHIDRVVRIQNPYIWDCYMLMKGEYEARLGSACKEMELFHATAQSNIPSVAQNNLDWRCTKRTKFGGGVSFSPLANYANKYCNVEAGTERALILARVLVGKSHEGRYGLKIPAEGYDTTTGNRKRVYVKYRDNEFYPEYVAYYRQ